MEPWSLHPLAVRAMAEIGIDISEQRSKSVDGYLDDHFDFVITVCHQARESRPVFPGAGRQLHWSFPDPAAIEGSEEERLNAFRRVREEMAARVRRFISQQSAWGAEAREPPP